MTNTFSTYHPAVNFTFFAAVILFSMIFMHPVFLAISLFSSLLYTFVLKGRKAVKMTFFFALPMLILIAVLNPVFVHDGLTVLLYVNDNPVTLEAVCYGGAAAALLTSVLLWFICYSEVVSSDKFIFLFGRFVPSAALLISMTLRFIPKFKNQITVISHAQKTIGMDAGTGGLRQRALHGMRIFTILMTWAMENAVETADSMKARGYGLKGRTSFSVFRFGSRDAVCLSVILAAVALCFSGYVSGAFYFQYYPFLDWAPFSPLFAVSAAAYAFVCLMPSAIEIREEIKWRLLKSRI